MKLLPVQQLDRPVRALCHSQEVVLTAVSADPSLHSAASGTPARRLRLLFFYDAVYPESLGGVEHRNYQLARALARRGHDVTIAGWFEDRDREEPGVRYLRLPGRSGLYTPEGKRSTLAAIRLALAAARLDLSEYDAVESANIPYIHLVPLSVRAWVQRRPLFVTWHEYWGLYWRDYLPGIRWPAYAALEWVTAQLGTRTSAVSSFTAERLRRRRLRRQEIGLIPNGIPLDRIRSVATAEPGPPLVYAGRLLREKRLDLLLEAVGALPAREDEKLLTIIGDGPDRERLQRVAADLGVESRVEFTGRLPAPEDVWSRMTAARIAVQPSSREGFGMFPLEAMALGLPVVYCTSPESALPELVRTGVEGVETEADARSLARTLEWLLSNGEQVERLSRQARLRAAEYDWDAIAARFEAIIEQHARRRA